MTEIGRGIAMMNLVQIEQHQGWAEIILDRPARRNALTPGLAAQLTTALEGLSRSAEVAAIVLRGADHCFCSGIDLKALQSNEDPGSEDGVWHQTSIRALHLALYRCPKPLICALEKYAINAGAALVFACDLVVAGDSAFLQIGEIQQGSDIPINAAWLRLKTSEQTLARLALLGDRVGATELAHIGLIQSVVPDDEVLTQARVWAARLASFPVGAGDVIINRIRSFRPMDPETVFPVSTNNALLTAAQVKS